MISEVSVFSGDVININDERMILFDFSDCKEFCLIKHRKAKIETYLVKENKRNGYLVLILVEAKKEV